jgi:hypothetical protein
VGSGENLFLGSAVLETAYVNHPEASPVAAPALGPSAQPDPVGPAQPDATSPAQPDATSPAQPDATSPAQPDATSPAQPAAASQAGVAGPVAPTAAAAGTHRPVIGSRLTGGLLHRWQHRSRTASLPLALRQLENAGNLDNVRLALRSRKRVEADGHGGRPAPPNTVAAAPGSGYRGPVFMDSDIYKTLEAIGWELAHGDRPHLASFAADVIGLLEQAQRPTAT